ncbi:type I phosphomannose isomerase catalytic subunit [Mucilaginibacter sp.]|uniref:type I phosphomannose isomerase catalytic subunit n=1 Tax=Mucilaginibacter sp. TaxID=1882438 RepID=UPI00260D03BC|nr:type I phosphomannose isomerase catalytic subunit [Mucilaginibacter sp.]MDB4925908.1 RmlC-like protein [Mucilaginibacter sp.]
MKPSETILKLLNNRVVRSYTGGKLIEQWQGLNNPADNDKPEEWLASVVEARNKNYIPGEGLSTVLMPDGSTAKLIDLIKADSEGFLGEEHVAKYGVHTAVLTKVLDAAVRLSIQVHPTKAYARDYFKSDYGKTEAWYIMGGREINGEPPYVLIGFKPDVTKAQWKKYFDEQDIDGMINALHKFYVQPGDVFLIEGGLPHAIGSGCFLIEIQEPTDYTMRVERKTFDGSTLPDMLCHQGVGFDAMLDCFTYEGLSKYDTLRKYAKHPEPVVLEDGTTVIKLITDADTACFQMDKLIIPDIYQLDDDSFKTLIILAGEGWFVHGGETIEVKQGDTYFLPADVGEVHIENSGADDLEIIACYPPQ